MKSICRDKPSLHSPVFSLKNKITRVVWGGVYWSLFRISPVPFFAFRRWLLSLFGATIHSTSRVYPSAKIWLPSNLCIGEDSTIGPHVDVYNQGAINVGHRVIISQHARICASTHDYNNPIHPLVLAPICIGSDVWICADAFVGPYSKVADGTVLGARSVLIGSTVAWRVYAGNPAVPIKKRKVEGFLEKGLRGCSFGK